MRVISLHQPWASLVALKLKCYETRSWYTNYRGQLLIHAAKRKCKVFCFGEKWMGREDYLYVGDYMDINEIPYGCVVAVASLTNCTEMTDYTIKDISRLEKCVGDWQPGRYAWKLENVQPINPPIAATGKQGLWIPDQDLIAKINEQLPVAK